MKEKFMALIILDGFGFRKAKEGNAIALAKKPFWDKIWAQNPHGLLIASGEAVGLPQGQMGNSEVGHTNLGAGRIVWQDIVRISRAIKTGEFFKNPVLLKLMNHGKNSRLHLVGLLSDGGVHSHIEHLKALLELAKRSGVKDVYIHAILDGRDTPPKSAEKYLKELMEFISVLGVGKIATMGGRYYYMDRDKRWDRTKKAYDAMVLGKGRRAEDPLKALKDAYERGETDEFVQPYVIDSSGVLRDSDAVFFFNFRADRMRQLVSAIALKDFEGFKREKFVSVYAATMTLYDETFPLDVAFPPQELKNVIGEVISNLGYRQLRIAETEKYAHVTYFFSGGQEKPFKGEDRVLIPSPKVATYDLKPQMSAFEVAEAFVKKLNENDYKLLVLNFANPDMVGHTGNLNAAIKAIEAVDRCLEKVVSAVLAKGGACIVTADHGNAEQMIDPKTGQPHTAHTTNPVPFVLLANELKGKVRLRRREKDDVDIPKSFESERILGILGDVSPTILKLLGIDIPPQMTGDTLVEV